MAFRGLISICFLAISVVAQSDLLARDIDQQNQVTTLYRFNSGAYGPQCPCYITPGTAPQSDANSNMASGQAQGGVGRPDAGNDVGSANAMTGTNAPILAPGLGGAVTGAIPGANGQSGSTSQGKHTTQVLD